MSDLIEPKVANQLPSAPLPLQDSDLVVVSRNGVNLLQSTLSEIISRANVTKLNGIASGATANSSDATLLNRANHTGTQASSTISDLTEAVQDIVGAQIVAGSNITTNYNDATGALTISSTASGSSTELELAITASRDALLTDVGNILTSNQTSAVVITIPSTATFNPPDGTILTAFQANTGAVSFAAGAGVTFEGTAPTSIENAHISLRKRTGDIWVWVNGVASGGAGSTLQTLTSASATTGINIATGANIVRISPAITANVNFTIVGGTFGDSLTLFITQDATGFREVILDGDIFTDDVTNIGGSQVMIQMVNDGTAWNVSNSPRWN